MGALVEGAARGQELVDLGAHVLAGEERPRLGVAEAALAFVLADALVDKLGGDTMSELLRSLEAYRADLAKY